MELATSQGSELLVTRCHKQHPGGIDEKEYQTQQVSCSFITFWKTMKVFILGEEILLSSLLIGIISSNHKSNIHSPLHTVLSHPSA